MSKILAIVILLLIAYSVLSQTNVIKNSGIVSSDAVVRELGQNQDAVGNENVLPFPQISNNFASQGTFSNSAQDLYSRDEVTAKDLLPVEGGYADSNPAPQGTLSNRNLFEAGHHAGLNTQLNSLRNGNRQLRSDPLIPRVSVGPWSQSTFEADTNRREFEIGGI